VQGGGRGTFQSLLVHNLRPVSPRACIIAYIPALDRGFQQYDRLVHAYAPVFRYTFVFLGFISENQRGFHVNVKKEDEEEEEEEEEEERKKSRKKEDRCSKE
jgi:hypothetical protein